jgi:hypothetical protein
MSTPVFDEVEPLPGCACEECARQRLVDSAARRTSGYGRLPVSATTRVVAVAAAVAAVGSGGAAYAAAPAPAAAPLPAAHQAPGAAPAMPEALAHVTRDQILQRARTWVEARVPYGMGSYWKDGYRQDCSGFVSMAWGLGSNEWTGTLPGFAERISPEDLRPGDILLFQNPHHPAKGSHVTIFGGWANASRTLYVAYEQTRPHARIRATPFAYWTNGGRYVPYRYKYVRDDTDDDFPGADSFGPGSDNPFVTELGELLIRRGGARYYRSGPGPRWTAADRMATRAFQRAQGWTGADANGIPGPATWRFLTHGEGRDLSGSGGGYGDEGDTRDSSAADRSRTIPPYPGGDRFRHGRSNDDVLALGRRLMEKGFGKHYRAGPSRSWSEADRRAVEAFQRAQGWSLAEADGHPGPETWRRLFS